nr:hypothetical protein [Streptomyces sp. B93]
MLVFGFLALCGQCIAQALFELLSQGWAERHGCPVVFHEPLDLADEQRLARAGRCLLVSPQAHEVRVDGAVSVLGVGDHQSAAAATAEDARLEVVPMLALLLADEVGSEYVLDLLPGDRIGEMWMVTRMSNTSVDHFTLVVRVGQDAVKDVRPDRASGLLRRLPSGQPTQFQLIGH